MANKEVYVDKQFNDALTSGSLFIIDVQDAADQQDYLPLNKLRITNLGEEQIWVYLDAVPVDTNAPDYVIGSGLGIDEGYLEGVQFNTVYIKNKGTGSISANKIAVRVAKVEEVQG